MSMNYRNADLNLLKIFEALMNECNVTAAAGNLRRSPVRANGAGIRPIGCVTELWTPLSRSLRTIRGPLEGESFIA